MYEHKIYEVVNPMSLLNQTFTTIKSINKTDNPENITTNVSVKKVTKILYKENEALYLKTIISPKLCELRNLINVAYIIIKHARKRKESRGLHYNVNYPKTTNYES